MKTRFFSFPSLVLSFFILFTLSCKTEEKKKEVIVLEKELAPPPAPTADIEKLMIIKHKVSNYKNWESSYETHDSVRIKYGLHNYLLTRGLDDSNIIQVALKMDNLEKAKEFSSLPSLKESMKKAGVIGSPEFEYLDIQKYDTAPTGNITARVVMKHEVKDYKTWKVHFDEHKQLRIDAGLTDRLLAYAFDNHNIVYVVNAVSDIKKAKDFFNSKELKEKMKDAGVEGKPTTFYYYVSKKY
jgi:hypothetical protein